MYFPPTLKSLNSKDQIFPLFDGLFISCVFDREFSSILQTQCDLIPILIQSDSDSFGDISSLKSQCISRGTGSFFHVVTKIGVNQIIEMKKKNMLNLVLCIGS